MYVIDGHTGLSGVLARALTDVHPPLYYFFLYGWIQLTGVSEWAVRLPSAVFAVIALLVFAGGTRKVMTPAASAFACAAASGSAFWFEQSQNARSYAMLLVISAAMLTVALALRRQVHACKGFPLANWILLTVLGMAGSMAHSYMLLATGMLLFFLILTLRDLRLQMALVVSGLSILALYLSFLWLLMHAVNHDFQHTWFRSDFGFFAWDIRRAITHVVSWQSQVVAIALLFVLLIRRLRGVRQERDADVSTDDARWATALCGFVLVGVVISGIAVSILVAPSFSDRNVLTCAPFAWLLIARLYDVAGPRLGSARSGVAITAIVLLLGSQLALLPGRMLPSNETWRAGADYIRQLPDCAGQPVPVVIRSDSYGLDTPEMRRFVEQNYFGYYLPETMHPQAYLPDELVKHVSTKSRVGANECSVIAWSEHDMKSADALKLAMELARQPSMAAHGVVLQQLVGYGLRWLSWRPAPNGYVLLRSQSSVLAPADVQASLTAEKEHAVGDRLLVRYITQGTQPVEGIYSIQRWGAGQASSEKVAVPK
ncbi:MAG: glycosyltransferase family 39 protein [Rhodanobacter sp.]